MSEISPSILAADLTSLERELAAVDTAERIHIDVMDGHFVPNLSFGFPTIDAVRSCTSLPIDVHLMVTNPLEHLNRLVSIGVDSVTAHVEATAQVEDFAALLENHNVAAGLAINPDTHIDRVTEHAPVLDRITVMGVEPGFGGQEFQPKVLDRINHLDSIFPGVVEIDGGIVAETAHRSMDAGADIVVSGSTIFRSDNRAEMIQRLRLS